MTISTDNSKCEFSHLAVASAVSSKKIDENTLNENDNIRIKNCNNNNISMNSDIMNFNNLTINSKNEINVLLNSSNQKIQFDTVKMTEKEDENITLIVNENEVSDCESDIEVESDLDTNSENLNNNQKVMLGFHSINSLPIENDIGISYVGGKPNWLNPIQIPQTSEILICKQCQNSLSFLCQLYAPLSISTETYHRVLYVFLCSNFSCIQNGHGSVVIRQQLPQKNLYWDSECIRINSNPLINTSNDIIPPQCVLCGLSADKWLCCSRCRSVYYCSKDHQLIDWKQCNHNKYCNLSQSSLNVPRSLINENENRMIDENRSKCLFPQFEIETESEYLDFDTYEYEKRLCAEYENSCKNQCNVNDDDEMNSYIHTSIRHSERDIQFEKFTNRIKNNPDQILRYSFGNNVLWCSSQKQLSFDEINSLRCGSCNSQLNFEFQLFPQLLYYLNLNSLDKNVIDFSTIVIFTCSNSCNISNKGYIKEFIYVQPPIELRKIQTDVQNQ